MGFVDTDTETKLDTSEGNHDRFAHYVNKNDMLEGYEIGRAHV